MTQIQQYVAGTLPIPTKVRFGNGNEFKKDFLTIFHDLAIKSTPTIVKNPQANVMLERLYQVLGDMLY